MSKDRRDPLEDLSLEELRAVRRVGSIVTTILFVLLVALVLWISL